ncbi:MAG: phosphatase PAP2 family protein [Firmicutes bacterium]|nr:phosphatase PAP2 family protein [Bacillota bacterium]
MKPETEGSRNIKHEALLVTLIAIAVFMCHILYLLLGRIDLERHDIRTGLDQAIPFVQEFVIPYLLWYVMIIATFLCYLIHESKDMIEIGIYDLIGLIICCAVFVIYPTEITFRPEYIAGSDFCSSVLRWMFNADKPYNVLPSMHCYEATAAFVGIMHSRYFSRKTWAKVTGAVLMVAIWMSTLFIKQHSVIDMAAGIALALILIPVIGIVRKKITEKGCI